MSHMNKRQRDYWYPILMKKQRGEFCNGCGIHKINTTERMLLIDHIDNNDSHNIESNLQLLCRSCNRIKNPSKQFVPDKPMTYSEYKNMKGEPRFRSWLFKQVLADGRIDYDEAIDSGAEECELSTETIKRYARKCLSKKGIYELDNGNIIFKGSPLSVEQELEEPVEYR